MRWRRVPWRSSILSGNDPGLDEVAEYFGLRGRRFSAHTNLTLHVLEKADHTLSALWARKRLQHCIAGYMCQRFRVIINDYPDVCCETPPKSGPLHRFALMVVASS